MLFINGLFESHITVHAETSEALLRFKSACAEIGVKCLYIELDSGAHTFQPMIGATHRGDFASVRREAFELEATLTRRGFAATRVKIEAFIENEGVPKTDAEAKAMGGGTYFEFHALVTLPSSEVPAALRSVCAAHGGHLSRNALKRDPDGRNSRFVTLRVAGVGSTRADSIFGNFLTALREAGFELSKIRREFVVFDSNLELDAGWGNVIVAGKGVV